MRQRRPAIVQLEIRMHIPNFINSGIDYDPGFSVLFEGSGTEGGNGGGCGAASNEVEIILPWLSLAFVILAIFFVFLGIVVNEIRILKKKYDVYKYFKKVRKDIQTEVLYS